MNPDVFADGHLQSARTSKIAQGININAGTESPRGHIFLGVIQMKKRTKRSTHTNSIKLRIKNLKQIVASLRALAIAFERAQGALQDVQIVSDDRKGGAQQ